MSVRAVAVFIACVAVPAVLSAHRLDEYLQATKLAVAADRVEIEMDLTPGAAVADEVFASIDRDGDGTIAPAEGRDYVERVLASTRLDIDGQTVPAQLRDYRLCDRAAMREGVGVIQLAAFAQLTPLDAGTHRLHFRNAYQPNLSVYLVNPLVPTDPAITITSQQRDVQQHELTLTIGVAARGGYRRYAGIGSGALIALVMAFPAALIWRRRSMS